MELKITKRFLIFQKKSITIMPEKIHAIKEDPMKLWKAGTPIQFALGSIKFGTSKCVSVQSIKFTAEDGILIATMGFIQLSHTEICKLAHNEGYEGYNELFKAFMPLVIERNGTYNGIIIHWTKFQYNYL